MLNNEDYLNIFHEIKNSITLINGSLQLVAKKHPEVINFDYWDETMSEVDFLKNMVPQLSSFRHCNQLNLIRVNIYAFIHQITNSIRAFSQDDFICQTIMEEDLPLIELDPQLIKQAMTNLVKNAYEAMHEAGTIQIHVCSRNEQLYIAVQDHGGGIDPSLTESIFQPFITSKADGSGLGLAITKQIIESHKGTLTCDSRPGDGCTFTICLPVRQN